MRDELLLTFKSPFWLDISKASVGIFKGGRPLPEDPPSYTM
jgi:hypothetical protein